MKKNVAGQNVGAQILALDGSAFAGDVDVYVTLDAGTQTIGSVGSGAATSEGNGLYTYAPSQGETNGDHVVFTFVPDGAPPVSIQMYPSFPQTGDAFARLGAPAGASVSADIAVIDGNVDDIEAKTVNLPSDPADASVIAGRFDTVDTALTNIGNKTTNLPSDPADHSLIMAAIAALNDFDPATDTVDIGKINGSAAAAIQLALSTGTIIVGTATSDTLSTTEMSSDITGYGDDHFNGRVLIWTSGDLMAQARRVEAYTEVEGIIQFSTATEAPEAGDTFIIV